MRFPEFTEKWETRALGEIATFSKGKGISKSDIEENGITECIRYGELYTHYREVINEIKSKTNVNTSTLVLSEKNDVIIPASGETTIDIATASCVLKSGIALGGDLNIIKTNNNGIFLSYYLNSKKKMEIANLAQGISVVHLYSSQLASLSLSLPELNEQNRISSFLPLLDERIQTQNKIINDLRTLKSATAKKIFSQELNFKDDDGNKFPEWVMKNLGEVCLNVASGKDKIDDNGNFNLYGSTGIIGKTNNVSYCGNYILIARVGANAGYLNKVNEKFGVTDNTIVVELRSNESTEFIYYILENFGLNKLIFGSGQPLITGGQLKNIVLRFPSIPEQVKIANFLSSIDSKIDIETELLQKLEEQKKILLQQMFV